MLEEESSSPVDSPVCVTFPQKLSTSLQLHLVQDLIKYLLFARQHIPCPYADLASSVKEEQEQRLTSLKRKRRLVSDVKTAKVVKTLDHIMQSLETMFHQHVITSVIVTFGSTVLQPKEAYVIRLPASLSDDGSALLESRAVLKKASMRLIRSLVTGCQHLLDESQLRKTPCFILAQSAGLRSQPGMDEVASCLSGPFSTPEVKSTKASGQHREDQAPHAAHDDFFADVFSGDLSNERAGFSENKENDGARDLELFNTLNSPQSPALSHTADASFVPKFNLCMKLKTNPVVIHLMGPGQHITDDELPLSVQQPRKPRTTHQHSAATAGVPPMAPTPPPGGLPAFLTDSLAMDTTTDRIAETLSLNTNHPLMGVSFLSTDDSTSAERGHQLWYQCRLSVPRLEPKP